MTSFIDEFMTDSNAYKELDADERKILLKSVASVLPMIIQNEMTDKQRICFELFYVHGKSQTEIAAMLKISQPTVSRHLKYSLKIVKKILFYCEKAVRNANKQWLASDSYGI